MCGRYTITVTIEEMLARYFAENVVSPYQPRYNVAPGQLVPAVINDGSRNRIGLLKWGLVPPWAEDARIGNKMINARAETIEERPAFRNAYLNKRCLLPADGFYEWQRSAGGKKPMRITLKGGGLFSLAGLYETWVSPEGEKWHTCTVLTTAPNRLMADIHDRMPVILKPEDEALWLDRRIREPARLKHLLVPYPEDEMAAYEVSAAVGNVRNDSPSLIERVAR
ncbi:SOS response-associated peptidase [Cohnella thailandensis]|uniref:Abasic site processing protein n=1 Tax=Cohnella thailandensis TaxID=557557 RepID=A0A841T3F3_9BACL|nr:SOS response-associated peptidase [Cohnella thailandensis]MBB6636580.1 SOS response-associated peptidase [Cohnella thailandensis]MBP1973547.1 putative SOS response-associated peptidase YedK [Cohnella thailandensis]